MTTEQIKKKTKSFQDWMDINHPNWVGCTDSKCSNGKNLNKGKGYGAFGPSTNKVWKLYDNDFNAQYNPQSDGGDATQQQETVDKSKQIFDEYNDDVFFKSVNNERFSVNYNSEISKYIKYFTKNGFNEPTSYVGSILSVYGNMISKYNTAETIQNEIDKNLPELQSFLKTLFEGIKLQKSFGLYQILEQISKQVTVNVINRIPQKQTEQDIVNQQYKDASRKTIKSIIGGGTEMMVGERGDTVTAIKKDLNYTVDKTPFFTDEFDKFIIDYKSGKNMDSTNGNISQELICSMERYSGYCQSIQTQKTTQPPVTQSSVTTQPLQETSIELKYLNDYVTAVGTGTPQYGPCKSLFDYYSDRALEFRRKEKSFPQSEENKESLKLKLQPIKDKIIYCQKSSDLQTRTNLNSLFSTRFRIQQDKNSPYYVDI